MYPAAVVNSSAHVGTMSSRFTILDYRRLECAPDKEVLAAASAEDRALVSENVPDFVRLEAEALARDEAHSPLVFTLNRQFPRGDPGTTGRLVAALHALMTKCSLLRRSLFLERPPL